MLEARAQRRIQSKARRNLLGHETILVVQDDLDVPGSTQRILRRFGYCLLAASDQDRALSTMADRFEGDIARLLTDVLTPKMHGPELAARFRLVRRRARAPRPAICSVRRCARPSIAGREPQEPSA